MNKILITGSAGFIGSNLLRDLYPYNKVFIILRKKLNAKDPINKYKNMKIIYYSKFDDLNKKLKTLRVDIVIHCATHYIKNHSYKDLLELNKSNILFGNIILENLKIMRTKKFINFSTVWEDYNSIKDNSFNLYSVYKKCFSLLINHYLNILPKINFYNLMISDTFGVFDKRLKIINILKKNYKSNKTTKIISKNLFLNLINVSDISSAVNLLIKNDIKTGKYLLKNKVTYKIIDLINTFNKNYDKKIKVKWLSNKTIYEKIYTYKKLKGWNPKQSSKNDIIKIIQKK
tara:strand:- start:1865 stop:2728 length:864 start_codon:yes stop_codon:yes gene_type:complete